MDPLNALAVATSVAQFLNFSSSIVSGMVGPCRSATGPTLRHDELECLTTRLKRYTDALGTCAVLDGPCTNGDEPAYAHNLKAVVGKSKSVAADLLSILNDMKANGRNELFGSLIATSRSCGKKAVQRLQAQLVALQSETELCLIHIVG